MRNLGAFVVAVAVVLGAGSAHAKKRPPRAPLEGMTEVARLAPDAGLIDVAIGDDGAGLLAYVVADAAAKAEVRVVEVATGKEVRRFDVSALTSQPERLWFVGEGVFVTGKPVGADGEVVTDGTVVGAYFDAAGVRAKKTFGPAPIMLVRDPDKAKPLVIVKKVLPGKRGAEVHQVERFDLRKGKRLGVKKLTLIDGRDDKLAFTVHHWTGDGLVAVGTKDGEWTRKTDTRAPDAEGRYDLVDGKKVVTTPIADPMAHARRYEVLAKEAGPSVFARVATDLTGLEVWRDEHPAAIALDQPFDLYDPKSLTWAIGDDGVLWLGLAIDPWNKRAVDRKKQDPEYFDVFRVDGAKAMRVARVLAPKKRFAIGATAGHLWMLERNVGFSRGGKLLTIYKLP
jgi:hypothetical protein